MIKEVIKEKIEKALEILLEENGNISFDITETKPEFGDYSTNVAMKLPKEAISGKSPKEVASRLVEILSKEDMFESVEVAGPGFINFKLSLPFWSQKIKEIIEAGDKYGRTDLGKDLKVNIEFISANPTGPLTLGNGRGGYFGDTLANIFSAYGAQVEREYYINDRGVQVTALGHSVLKDSEAVYKGPYIDEIAPKIKSKNAKEAGQEAAAILLTEYIQETIQKMNIKFDHWFSEKRMFDSGKVSFMIEHLNKKGMTYEQEGALWLKTTDFGDDKDRVLVTKEGEHTYFACDIAYHHDKITRGYDLLIDFWGADHHGYIGRMQAAVEVLRNDEIWNGKLEVLIAQLVRLMANGQEVKMSKRAGTYVTLDELLDEVGPDVTRFFFLDRALNTHMDFDLDLAKEKSQKNPVYYVQYAYARINSILAKSGSSKTDSKFALQYTKKEEIALIRELVKLPELINEIVSDYQVQKLTFYARNLADKFHKFYENCPIISEENEESKNSRLVLIFATKIVLKNTLDLLGVSSPEKM